MWLVQTSRFVDVQRSGKPVDSLVLCSSFGDNWPFHSSTYFLWSIWYFIGIVQRINSLCVVKINTFSLSVFLQQGSASLQPGGSVSVLLIQRWRFAVFDYLSIWWKYCRRYGCSLDLNSSRHHHADLFLHRLGCHDPLLWGSRAAEVLEMVFLFKQNFS